MIPAGTIPAVATAPVAAIAEEPAAALVNSVVVPVAEALPVADVVPVLEPALQPVIVLAESVLPPLTAIAIPDVGTAASAQPAAATDGSGAPLPAVEASGAGDLPPASVTSVQLQGSAATQGATSLSATPSAALSSPPAGNPPAPPVPAPAGPASGSGFISSSSGTSGGAAWLDESGGYLPPPGSLPLLASLEHTPAPVSFDPGSTPD